MTASSSVTYDELSRIVEATSPRGAVTRYDYDQLETFSQLERHPTPGTYTSTYSYDDAGNLLTAAAPSARSAGGLVSPSVADIGT